MRSARPFHRRQINQERPSMKTAKWIARASLSAAIALAGADAHAQQPKKVPRVGYLTGATLSANSARQEDFRQGLRELGYVEGENIVIDWRSAEEKPDRLPLLARELVRLKIDIIVTGSSSPALRDLVETLLDCQPLPQS